MILVPGRCAPRKPGPVPAPVRSDRLAQVTFATGFDFDYYLVRSARHFLTAGVSRRASVLGEGVGALASRHVRGDNVHRAKRSRHVSTLDGAGRVRRSRHKARVTMPRAVPTAQVEEAIARRIARLGRSAHARGAAVDPPAGAVAKMRTSTTAVLRQHYLAPRSRCRCVTPAACRATPGS